MNSLNKKIKKASPRYKQRLDTHQLAIQTANFEKIRETLVDACGLEQYNKALKFLPPSDSKCVNGKAETWERQASKLWITNKSYEFYKKIAEFVKMNKHDYSIIEARPSGFTRDNLFMIKMSESKLLNLLYGDGASKRGDYKGLMKNLKTAGLLTVDEITEKDKWRHTKTHKYICVKLIDTVQTLIYLDFVQKYKLQKYRFHRNGYQYKKGEKFAVKVNNRINNRLFFQFGHEIGLGLGVVALREAFFNLLGVYYDCLLKSSNFEMTAQKTIPKNKLFVDKILKSHKLIQSYLDLYENGYGFINFLHLPITHHFLVKLLQARETKLNRRQNYYRNVEKMPASAVTDNMNIDYFVQAFFDKKYCRNDAKDELAPYLPLIQAINTVTTIYSLIGKPIENDTNTINGVTEEFLYIPSRNIKQNNILRFLVKFSDKQIREALYENNKVLKTKALKLNTYTFQNHINTFLEKWFTCINSILVKNAENRSYSKLKRQLCEIKLDGEVVISSEDASECLANSYVFDAKNTAFLNSKVRSNGLIFDFQQYENYSQKPVSTNSKNYINRGQMDSKIEHNIYLINNNVKQVVGDAPQRGRLPATPLDSGQVVEDGLKPVLPNGFFSSFFFQLDNISFVKKHLERSADKCSLSYWYWQMVTLIGKENE